MFWFDGRPMKKPGGNAATTARSFFYWDSETLVFNILDKPSAKQKPSAIACTWPR
jgi:hypothetical protein